MNWTQDQQQAIEKIKIWRDLNIYVNDEDAFFNLSGAAGTGKSTVVLEILKHLKGKVCVSAPTHKAKDVISQITNKPGITIHSLLGLRPNLDLEDYDPSNPQYAPIAEELISSFDIIIVDECSMVNKMLFKILIERANQYKKRIIFVGDDRQLPPVNERISLTFNVKHKARLNEVVRQEHTNPNQQLLLDSRKDVEENSILIHNMFKTPIENINIFSNNGKEQGYIVTANKEEFYNKLIELYSDTEAKTNMNFIKTLCYTNNAVEDLNKFIKNRINPSKELITDGDFLLGYDTKLDENDRIIVQNSSDYYVHHVIIVTKTIMFKKYKFYRVVIETTGKYIDILHPDSYPYFQENLEVLHDNGRKNKAWRAYYRYKDQFILMKHFYHRYETDRFGKGLHIAKKSIDLAYAMTVHKS